MVINAISQNSSWKQFIEVWEMMEEAQNVQNHSSSKITNIGNKWVELLTLSVKRFFLFLFLKSVNWNPSWPCKSKEVFIWSVIKSVTLYIHKTQTLWIRLSSIIELLNFLKSSYNASTALTVTAYLKMFHVSVKL